MPVFTDQLENKITLTSSPKRIISLVPSQTELLYDLGLTDEVVGITKFCIHPDEWFRSKTRVGGTKTIDFERIRQLQPDLIIGNKEENQKEQIEQLMEHYPVWMSDIYTFKDALNMITQIGTLVGKRQEAIVLKLRIEAAFDQLENKVKNLPPGMANAVVASLPNATAIAQGRLSSKPQNLNPELQTPQSQLPTSGSQRTKVSYFIWQKPFMVAGNHTFINDMLCTCGFNNIFATSDLMRYPEVSVQQIAAANPEVILLSSEPYPFKDKHIKEFQSICPGAKIIIVDGELFSWYGSRLLHAPAYFEKLMGSMH